MDDEQRNTRPAPPIGDRCDTCGATRLSGQGRIRRLHNIPLCTSCRTGVLELVRSDPNYTFGVDGRLVRTGPEDPAVTERRSEVDRLAAALSVGLDGVPVEIDVFHPQSGVAVVMPNGYRWHIYGRHFSGASYTARLFTPGREMVGGVHLALSDKLEEVADDVLNLLIASRLHGNPISESIDADVLARAEIALFTPDQLLDGT